MTKRVRVNVRALANTKAARREKRNGRDVIIVPSATLPDDVVMNNILYPADEIEKSFASLNRTPAPAGHPLINGKFVSARDPEGINIGWIGAWNENARREGGRVLLDKVIDVQTANQSERGKAVLEAVDKGEPIHTSTGLLCNLEAANGDVAYKHIARDIDFDHDAILLDEEGAATPGQGVGMFVNSAGQPEELEVINSAIDMADQELDWAGMHLLSALERRERASTWERIKSAIMDALPGASEREPSANQGEADMADEKQLEQLSAKVNAIEEGLSKIGETIANAVGEAVKPLKDHVESLDAANKAKEDAEKAELEAKVVKANILDEETAKATPLNTLRALAPKAAAGKAAALNGAFGGSSDKDEWDGFSLNAAAKQKEA
ncbi:hypothetical protein [Salipiger bermudensis]|uniref:hypothetical protein n=1 Tax=Salipiger bermudensis TaxID=344736 RepID=UPI001CD38D43|nr:hypothetical protein [Salipiger bermudensis]MCA0961160.1 hypothetical protein [Salipiger bermudensis]